MRFIFTSVKHPNQYTCLLKGFLSPIDPVSSRVDSRQWNWISTECVLMTVLGLSSAIPPHLFLLLRLAFVRTYPRILECERHDCFGKHNLPDRSNLFDARWYFLASSCDLLPSSVGFLKNPVHGSMVGRQISVESDSAASTVGRSLVADHEKVRILLNPYKKTSRLLARSALNVPQESATEPANSHRLLADVEGAGTMQPTTGAAAPTMGKGYSLRSGTIGH